MPDRAELQRRFTYHPPDEETRALHDQFRVFERNAAEIIDAIPGGDTREKSLAFTKLEELAMWVHAHIARNLSGSG